MGSQMEGHGKPLEGKARELWLAFWAEMGVPPPAVPGAKPERRDPVPLEARQRPKKNKRRHRPGSGAGRRK
jgi:hypothetical protein